MQINPTNTDLATLIVSLTKECETAFTKEAARLGLLKADEHIGVKINKVTSKRYQRELVFPVALTEEDRKLIFSFYRYSKEEKRFLRAVLWESSTYDVSNRHFQSRVNFLNDLLRKKEFPLRLYWSNNNAHVSGRLFKGRWEMGTIVKSKNSLAHVAIIHFAP